jgi:CRISPR-associated protein Cmr6
MSNLGWLFYKNYYHGFQYNIEGGKVIPTDSRFFESKNRKILDFIPDLVDAQAYYHTSNTSPLLLRTLYPGLLIGTGYGHQTGSEGEFKLGFFFDHTTGLPLISGSSVKGVLRSYFPKFDTEDNNPFIIKENKITENQKFKAFYIYSLWKNEPINLEQKDNLVNMYKYVHNLELEIFEGYSIVESFSQSTPQYLSIYKRDIFHDAFIEKTENTAGKIMGDDSITPHGVNPLRNPIPITFLKILPSVSFRFNFDVKTNFFEAAKKEKLFKTLLLQNGIGAKTNVGYGQLEIPTKNNQQGNQIKFEEITGEIIEVNPHKAQVICQLSDGSKKTIQFENALQLQMKGYKKGQKVTLQPQKGNPKEYEIK